MKQNKLFGTLLLVALLCVVLVAFTACNVSAGDPNQNPIFWPDGFVEFEGETYHVEDGKLSKGRRVVENRVYHFDEESGAMSKNAEIEGYTFGEEGYMLADQMFFDLEGDRYYLVNNYVIENYYVVDGQVYDFGDDGKMVEH